MEAVGNQRITCMDCITTPTSWLQYTFQRWAWDPILNVFFLLVLHSPPHVKPHTFLFFCYSYQFLKISLPMVYNIHHNNIHVFLNISNKNLNYYIYGGICNRLIKYQIKYIIISYIISRQLNMVLLTT